MRFFLNRVGFLLLSVWAAITVNFLIPRMMPGSPVDAILAHFQSEGAPLGPNALHALEQQFGLSHAPLWTQYFGYVNNLFHGQLGTSITYYPLTVTEVIGRSLPWTLGLAGTATIISVLLGTFLGIYAAWHRGTRIDATLTTVTMFTSAIPYFWIALILVYLFGFELNWFPQLHAFTTLSNGVPWWRFSADVLYHAVLPGATIVISAIGGWLVGMRNNMVQTLGEDYVTFARARGVRDRRLMVFYAARNAILPNLTGFAMAIGFVVGGALLTEIVFSYPGIGMQLLTAVENEDYPLMQGIFLIIALAVLFANFLVELIYGLLDPRARQGE